MNDTYDANPKFCVFSEIGFNTITLKREEFDLLDDSSSKNLNNIGEPDFKFEFGKIEKDKKDLRNQGWEYDDLFLDMDDLNHGDKICKITDEMNQRFCYF